MDRLDLTLFQAHDMVRGHDRSIAAFDAAFGRRYRYDADDVLAWLRGRP